jgi:ABC-type phosphate transport system permease subunit
MNQITLAPDTTESARASAQADVLASWDSVREPTPWVGLALPALILIVGLAGTIVGTLALSLDSLEAMRLPLMGALAGSLLLFATQLRLRQHQWDLEVVALGIAALLGTGVLALLPEYMYGGEINAIVHRSLFTAIILLTIAPAAGCTALYHLLGSTPSARDVSRYPLVILPILIVLVLYGAILLRLVQEGLPGLSWQVITHQYVTQLGANGQAGLRSHILGTLLLICMTCAIALPIGIGTGWYIAEYGGRLAHVIGFSASMLRAMSVFILALSAFNLTTLSRDHPTQDGLPFPTLLSDLVRGSYQTGGFKHAGNGSFLLVSVFLALLVIPVIARATEEGLRSLPHEIREGSHALGATDGHTFLHILLPWALPNIVTGLLLGAAEAAGGVTVLLFVAGTGERGVGPLHEVTSLGFLIFQSVRGPKTFTNVMGEYQFTAALLLLCITFALTIAALFMRQRFGKRYRGGISYS